MILSWYQTFFILQQAFHANFKNPISSSDFEQPFILFPFLSWTDPILRGHLHRQRLDLQCSVTSSRSLFAKCIITSGIYLGVKVAIHSLNAQAPSKYKSTTSTHKHTHTLAQTNTIPHPAPTQSLTCTQTPKHSHRPSSIGLINSQSIII